MKVSHLLLSMKGSFHIQDWNLCIAYYSTWYQSENALLVGANQSMMEQY